MNLISFLFKCQACDLSIQTMQTFPLCFSCFETLKKDSELSHLVCHQCLTLCKTPGMHFNSPFISKTPHQEVAHLIPQNLIQSPLDQALFATVLTQKSLEVLKAWKKRRSFFLTHKIFFKILNPITIQTLKKFDIDYIIPVPHSIKRLRKLNGSPPLVLATLLSKIINKPIQMGILQKDNSSISHSQLGFKSRLSQHTLFRIQLNEGLKVFKNKKLLIVDDIATTTSTLQSAAKLLRLCYPKSVCGFSWGVRLGALELSG